MCKRWHLSLMGLLSSVSLACSSEPPSEGAPSRGEEIGKGDGSRDSVGFDVVYESSPARSATDLAFDPRRPDQLWTVVREFPVTLPCTNASRRGCAALEGSVVIITNATTPTPSAETKKDPNAWHFMRRPTAIAFGDNGNFATCGEARTDNFEDEELDYSGPTLWSSDPAIFGIQPIGKNGSHLDMLHESPFCMGIAHEHDNVYWAYNGQIGALDRYDFKAPHEIGGEDHSDGELLRYAEGQLKRVAELPSHMVFDAESGNLYIADTGNQRIAKLDTRSGTPGLDFPALDPILVHKSMERATLVDFVPPGSLNAPTGIALRRRVLFVADAGTSRIHAFDLDGNLLRSLDTGLPVGSLGGIALSEDGKVFFTDLLTSRVFRIEPR